MVVGEGLLLEGGISWVFHGTCIYNVSFFTAKVTAYRQREYRRMRKETEDAMRSNSDAYIVGCFRVRRTFLKFVLTVF